MTENVMYEEKVAAAAASEERRRKMAKWRHEMASIIRNDVKGEISGESIYRKRCARINKRGVASIIVAAASEQALMNGDKRHGVSTRQRNNGAKKRGEKRA